MTIATRGANPGDAARLHEIFRAAFGKEDESDLWSYLLAHDSLLNQDDVRLALDDAEQPVAVTVLQPRPMRSRYGWVPGAIVTLVACDPAAQKRGYGAATIRSAIDRMAAEGIAVGILYGVAEYYPRFGFVPVLPACRAEVTTAMLRNHGDARLRPVTLDDLTALAALYAEAYEQYPCAVRREAAAELWNVRVPELNAVLILPDQTGYAFVRRNADLLYVYEAAVADADAGRRLLAAIGHEAAAHGFEKVMLSLPPDHLLTRLLSLGQCRQTRATALHGMVIVTDWSRVLAPGYSVNDKGLLLDGRLAVRADHKTLTELVMGYRSIDDLRLIPGVQIAAAEAMMARLAIDFPPAFPKWSLDPFWEGA
ncbi:MAG TPA: GNAT family N-acetyltransferase [Symbiobacteriaceae bacterium]|nr:GNAT family N-acetyltransferase [Symbiobacteriaceae bacterium]